MNISASGPLINAININNTFVVFKNFLISLSQSIRFHNRNSQRLRRHNLKSEKTLQGQSNISFSHLPWDALSSTVVASIFISGVGVVNLTIVGLEVVPVGEEHKHGH